MHYDELRSIKAGYTLVYNDGRPGHIDVKAEVLEVGEKSLVVQFTDRYSPTTIMFNDDAWWANLRRE